MPMTREQWEAFMIAKHGSLEEACRVMAEQGRKGGSVTRDRGHLEKVNFQAQTKERLKEISSAGGRGGK